MYNLKQRSVIKASAILLALVFILPSAFNLIHSLKHKHHHQYELCDNPYETHFHKLEKDCDFCKFKINQDYHNTDVIYKFTKVDVSAEILYVSYSFQYNYQHVSFSLRAPPVLV